MVMVWKIRDSAKSSASLSGAPEPFRRGDLDYFFAYPEDYSQQSPEWVNGPFGIRPHNPPFEVIFVYSQYEGSLDLNYRGSYKAIELWRAPAGPRPGRRD